MKVRTCSLPCIMAKITATRDGYLKFRCPKDCMFARYKDVPGPLDKWLEGEL